MSVLNDYSDSKYDPDLLLLSLIDNKKEIHWNADTQKIANSLTKEGYLEYVTGYYCGYFVLTKKGKKFLGDKCKH